MEPLLDYANVYTGSVGYEPDGRAYLYHHPQGVSVELNVAEKSPALFTNEKPWEKMSLGFVTVRRDGGKYRSWYGARIGKGANEQFLCYAESDDGFSWKKPGLGLFEFGGSRKNNIVSVGPHALQGSVFIDRDAPPDERYKKMTHCPQWYHEGQEISAPEGLKLWKELGEAGLSRDEVRQKVRLVGTHRAEVSPDGIHWTLRKEPLFEMFCDSQTVGLYDEVRKVYVGYFRTHTGGRRGIGRSETRSFRTWPEPQPVFIPDLADGLSDSFYTNAYCRYPESGLHLMFPAVFHQIEDNVDVQLAVSRDGINWYRPQRKPIVPSGTLGSGEEGGPYVGPELLELPDGRFAVPYHASGSMHNEGYYRAEPRNGRIAWASWPKHRLGGLRAAKLGAFTLTSRNCDGAGLFLNCLVQRGGWIRAALYRDLPYPPESTKPIDGYGFEDCDPVTGDHGKAQVRWRGSPDLTNLRDQKVCIRFELSKATLFAFEFGEEEMTRHTT